jgi:hypothetical protein
VRESDCRWQRKRRARARISARHRRRLPPVFDARRKGRRRHIPLPHQACFRSHPASRARARCPARASPRRRAEGSAYPPPRMRCRAVRGAGASFSARAPLAPSRPLPRQSYPVIPVRASCARSRAVTSQDNTSAPAPAVPVRHMRATRSAAQRWVRKSRAKPCAIRSDPGARPLPGRPDAPSRQGQATSGHVSLLALFRPECRRPSPGHYRPIHSAIHSDPARSARTRRRKVVGVGTWGVRAAAAMRWGKACAYARSVAADQTTSGRTCTALDECCANRKEGVGFGSAGPMQSQGASATSYHRQAG